MDEQALFEQVLDAPPGERAALVARLSAGQPELRARLDQLLAIDALLDEPELAALPIPPLLEVGALFAGRFKLRERLGEGGMGVVFAAEQTEPVRRRVALKAIKASGNPAQLRSRFEQERQALALMDHPNIAKVLDAGVADGVPYLAMELVKGVPISAYCDDARLTVGQRLELFVPVCLAVQHAHQKGIIHRDLKPSNILVALHDGLPTPKVIDFGVAKLTGARLAEHSVYTEVGSLVGTLEYMSPEQANLDNLDVDTRTDIYALGAVLYELLAGQVPFRRQDHAAGGLHEMLLTIKNVEPARPSAKLTQSAALATIAADRQVEPGKLAGLLRGELDWIAMKCLEKDRGRRYETAGALARDLQRHLADEPVEAGPPSAWYRARKLLRRHRGPTIAAALVLGSLLLGIAGTTWGLVYAYRERAYYLKMSPFLREQLLALACAEGRDAFAGELLGEPGKGRPLKEPLDRAASGLKEPTGLEPRIEGDLCWVVGMNYRGIGELEASIRLLERCAKLRTKQFGPHDKQTLVARFDYAETLRQNRRWPEAIAVLETVRAAELARVGPGDPRSWRAAAALATACLQAGRKEQALPLLAELRGSEQALDPKQPETLAARYRLASACLEAGLAETAITLLEEARDALAIHPGADPLDALKARNRLGIAYREGNRAPEALALARAVWEDAKRLLPEDHPFVLAALRNLALAHHRTGNPAEAAKLLKSIHARLAEAYGPDHPDAVETEALLAAALAAKP